MAVHRPRLRYPWRDFKPSPPDSHDALADDLALYLNYRSRSMLTWRNVTFDLRGCIDLDWLETGLRIERNWARRGDGIAPLSSMTNLRLHGRACRPDVLAIRAQISAGCNPIIYEVKASRSDFLSDVRAGKWRLYRQLARQVFFATPDGLIDKQEVPEGAGLIVRKKDHWRRVVDAPQADWQPGDAYWMTLLVRQRDLLPWEPVQLREPIEVAA